MTGQLFTFAEAAERLALPESWLRTQVRQRKVPHTRLGRHVRFTDEHLEQIVAAGETGPTATPTPTPRRRLRSASST